MRVARNVLKWLLKAQATLANRRRDARRSVLAALLPRRPMAVPSKGRRKRRRVYTYFH